MYEKNTIRLALPSAFLLPAYSPFDSLLKRPGSGPGEANSTQQYFLHPLPRLA